MPEKLPSAVYKAAKHVGLKVRYTASKRTVYKHPMYDGKGQAVVGGYGLEDGISSACHEIGHWLMATPADRQRIDYGGAGPEPRASTWQKPMVTEHAEEDASFAGIILEARIISREQARNTAYEHAWIYDTHPRESLSYMLTRARKMVREGKLVRGPDHKLWPKGLEDFVRSNA